MTEEQMISRRKLLKTMGVMGGVAIGVGGSPFVASAKETVTIKERCVTVRNKRTGQTQDICETISIERKEQKQREVPGRRVREFGTLVRDVRRDVRLANNDANEDNDLEVIETKTCTTVHTVDDDGNLIGSSRKCEDTPV